jgi:hypothetical protein
MSCFFRCGSVIILEESALTWVGEIVRANEHKVDVIARVIFFLEIVGDFTQNGLAFLRNVPKSFAQFFSKESYFLVHTFWIFSNYNEFDKPLFQKDVQTGF